MPSKLSRADLDAILAEDTPFADQHGFTVESLSEGAARCRLPFSDQSIRPGGTIAGPSMFALADFALWVAVMTRVGPQPLAVTTDMTIHFMAKPERGDLIGDARVIKTGKRLCVGEVSVFNADDPEEVPVSHVVGTYSVPPRQD